MEAQLKLAMAMSILRSRSKQSQAVQDLQHWKKKAKERKEELIKLKNDIKEVKDGMLSEMLPQVSSCKCQFFEILNCSSIEEQIRGQEADDCAMNDVLLRQFLRKDRYSCDGEKGNLVSVADFLVELVSMHSPAFNKLLFSTYAHQAVDFIKDSVQGLSTREEDETFIIALVDNLILLLINRIYSTPKHNDLDASVCNTEFHVQHIMLKLGAVPFIGQRILLGLLEEWVKCYLRVKKIGEMLEPRNSLYATYIDRITGEIAKQLNKIASSKEHNNEKDKFLDIWSSLFTQNVTLN